jgi:predicted deacetylase
LRTRKLLASVHDVTPAHTARLDRLVPMIQQLTGGRAPALLVVPDYHRRAPIKGDRAFARWLRSWVEQGSEMFLHGFTHKDEAVHAAGAARWKAQRMTAGEGEFLGLGAAEARRRLIEGRRIVEDIGGQAVAGFIAPAWLYGAPSLELLRELAFPLAEDHFRVWRPESGAVLTRGPVITYASRTPMRLASSLLWSQVARHALRRASVVRFAVHPGDADSPALLREIAGTLRSFGRSHAPARYADLP